MSVGLEGGTWEDRGFPTRTRAAGLLAWCRPILCSPKRAACGLLKVQTFDLRPQSAAPPGTANP